MAKPKPGPGTGAGPLSPRPEPGSNTVPSASLGEGPGPVGRAPSTTPVPSGNMQPDLDRDARRVRKRVRHEVADCPDASWGLDSPSTHDGFGASNVIGRSGTTAGASLHAVGQRSTASRPGGPRCVGRVSSRRARSKNQNPRTRVLMRRSLPRCGSATMLAARRSSVRRRCEELCEARGMDVSGVPQTHANRVGEELGGAEPLLRASLRRNAASILRRASCF